MKIKITKSMLNTYSYCPYRFYREYILKVKYQPSDVMVSGTKLHDFFDWFFDHWEETPPEKWELMIPDEFTEKEREQCRVFLRGEKARLEGLMHTGCVDEFVPPFREKHFDLPDKELHGYIDRIDYWNKNTKEFVIVEYKTGWGHNITKLKQELAFYKMLFEEKGCGTIPYYLIINPNRRIREYVKASSRGVTAAKKRVEVLRKAIADNNFPKECSPEKRRYCKHCEDETCDCYEHQI